MQVARSLSARLPHQHLVHYLISILRYMVRTGNLNSNLVQNSPVLSAVFPHVSFKQMPGANGAYTVFSLNSNNLFNINSLFNEGFFDTRVFNRTLFRRTCFYMIVFRRACFRSIVFRRRFFCKTLLSRAFFSTP
jgi:hypothetical protein